MADFIKLPRSALDKLTSIQHKGIFVALLEKADEKGSLLISVRRFANEIGVSYQQLRTALGKMCDNALINAASNESLTQNLTQITICGFDGCAKPFRRSQRKSNAAPNAASNANVSQAELPFEPYVDPRFSEAWQKWLDYRREVKKTYKSPASRKTAYDKMVRMANNDPEQAMDMVERAILGQWQGLHETKQYGAARPITPAIAAKERRDRGLSLANTIVSRSENLLNLYNGCGPNTDYRENQE